MRKIKIAKFQVDLKSEAHKDFFGLRIPEHLVAAAESRKVQFAAGRFCVQKSLGVLGYRDEVEVPIGPNGAPVWPTGVMGSITHTRFLARAVMGYPVELKDEGKFGIGIDSERVMSEEVAQRVSKVVLTPADSELYRQMAGMEFATFVSCAFSIKESLFKALSPLNAGVTLGFRSIELVELSLEKSSFAVRVLGQLLDLSMGLQTAVYLKDEHVHSEVYFGFEPLFSE